MYASSKKPIGNKLRYKPDKDLSGGERSFKNSITYVPLSNVYKGVIVTNRYEDDKTVVSKEQIGGKLVYKDIDWVKISTYHGNVYNLNILTEKVYNKDNEIGYIKNGMLYKI